MNSDIKAVTAIIRGRVLDATHVVHLTGTPHEKHAASKQSCCWGSPVIVGKYEIAVCCPSRRQAGDTRTAFFTYKVI